MTLEEFEKLKTGALVKTNRGEKIYKNGIVEKVIKKGTIGNVTHITGTVEEVGGGWSECHNCHITVHFSDYEYSILFGYEQLELI